MLVLVYFVFHSYGAPIKNAEGKSEIWRPVQECRKITRTWCDLSNETKAEEQGYFARVRAIGPQSSSTWAVTPRFDPKSESKQHALASAVLLLASQTSFTVLEHECFCKVGLGVLYLSLKKIT